VPTTTTNYYNYHYYCCCFSYSSYYYYSMKYAPSAVPKSIPNATWAMEVPEAEGYSENDALIALAALTQRSATREDQKRASDGP